MEIDLCFDGVVIVVDLKFGGSDAARHGRFAVAAGAEI